MALAAVLSAVRELILVTDQISEVETERRNSYRERFPELSIHEVEDLAKITPNKFRTYTSTIIHGEKNLIRNNLPATVKILKDYWPTAYGNQFNLFEFTRELGKVRPWRGNASVLLVENFVQFILEDHEDIVSVHPSLKDIARFELQSMKVRRVLELEYTEPSINKSSFATLTVGELLQLQYVIRSPVQFELFQTKLIENLNYYYENDFFPDKMHSDECVCVASRSDENNLRWRELKKPLYDLLSRTPRLKPQPIESLAEAYVTAYSSELGADSSEEALFTGFLSYLLALIDDGVCVAVR